MSTLHGTLVMVIGWVFASATDVQSTSSDVPNVNAALSEERALKVVFSQIPDLLIFEKNPGLPPRSIKSAQLANGDWAFAFIVLGSGVVGIRQAKCYRVYRMGEVKPISQFIGERAYPVDWINPATCRP